MSSRVSNTINKYLLPTDRVLDVGCGIGNIAVGLKCAHITGIDIVDDYLIQFKNRVPEAEVLKIDISNFDYKRFDNEIKTVRKFDVVLCIDLIEHLEPGIDKRFLKYMESTAERLIVVFSPEHAEDPNKIVASSIRCSFTVLTTIPTYKSLTFLLYRAFHDIYYHHIH